MDQDFIHQLVYLGHLSAEQKNVPIHARQVEILMSHPKFILVLKEHVLFDAIAYGLAA